MHCSPGFGNPSQFLIFSLRQELAIKKAGDLAITGLQLVVPISLGQVEQVFLPCQPL
jgi:hypothetical protein